MYLRFVNLFEATRVKYKRTVRDVSEIRCCWRFLSSVKKTQKECRFDATLSVPCLLWWPVFLLPVGIKKCPWHFRRSEGIHPTCPGHFLHIILCSQTFFLFQSLFLPTSFSLLSQEPYISAVPILSSSEHLKNVQSFHITEKSLCNSRHL